MLQPHRQAGVLGRYGFNGKEQDPEVKGNAAQYDYGFRIYDPRIGKFLSCDPLSSSYPELTPYQFSSNNPILFIDVDGLEGDFFFNKDEQGRCTLINYVDYGQGANRWFVRDNSASSLTKNRYAYEGNYYEIVMTPSSFYDDDDYRNPQVFSWNSQSQFDKDRNAWLNGGEYSDMTWWQRFKQDRGDNPDADNMMAALSIATFSASLPGGRITFRAAKAGEYGGANQQAKPKTSTQSTANSSYKIGATAGRAGASNFSVLKRAKVEINKMTTSGSVDQSALKSFLPANAKNTFIPSERITQGYKYQLTVNGIKVEIKWHGPDVGAPAGSNSARLWTSQIKIGNRYLGTDGKLYKSKFSDKTHIPVNMQR